MMKRKLLSLLLATLMLVSLFPTGALAAGEDCTCGELAEGAPHLEGCPLYEAPVAEQPAEDAPPADEPPAEDEPLPVVDEAVSQVLGGDLPAPEPADITAERLSLPAQSPAELEGLTIKLPLNFTQETVDVLLSQPEGTYTHYSVGEGAVLALAEGALTLSVPVISAAALITINWYTAVDAQPALIETASFTISRAQAAAKIGTFEYASVAEAVDAAEADDIIVLQNHFTGAGFATENGDDFTLDLGGYTYTVNGPVGSPGTVTNGLQLIKGSTVKIMNGTLAAANGVNVKILIKNYSDLTLENIVIPKDNISLLAICNTGKLTINGDDTSIAKPDGKTWAITTGNYGRGDVITTTVNAGTIESLAIETPLWETGSATVDESVTLTVNGGYIGLLGEYDWRPDYGEEYANAPVLTNARIIVAGGHFAADPAEYVDVNHTVELGEGAYPYSVLTGAFKIGGTSYGTAQAAVDAAEADDIIVLQRSVTGAGFATENGDDFTLDLGGYTYTVNGPVGSPGTVTNGLQLIKGSTVKIMNGTLAAASGVNVKILIKNYSDLTLENIVIPKDNISLLAICNTGKLTIDGDDTSIAKPDGKTWAITTGNYGRGDVITTTVNAGTIESLAIETPLWETGSATVDESVTLTVTGGYIGLIGEYDWRPDYGEEYANAPVLTNAEIIIYGGHFATDPTEYAAMTYGTEFDGTAPVYKYTVVRLLNNVIRVQQLIAELPAADEVTLADKAQIEAAREAYEGLATGKGAVSDVRLLAAEAALEAIESFIETYAIAVDSAYVLREGEQVTAAWSIEDENSAEYPLTWTIPGGSTVVTAEGATISACELAVDAELAEVALEVGNAELGIYKNVYITVLPIPAAAPVLEKVLLTSAGTVTVNALREDNAARFTIAYVMSDGTTLSELPEEYVVEAALMASSGATVLMPGAMTSDTEVELTLPSDRAGTYKGKLTITVTTPGDPDPQLVIPSARLDATVKVVASKPVIKSSRMPTLNTFYAQASGELTFTSTSGDITDITLPDTAPFEYDFVSGTLSVKDGEEPAAKTALMFTVTVDGYKPTDVKLTALTKVTAPKVKLAKAATTVKAFEDFEAGVTEPKTVELQLIPSARNVELDELEATGVSIAAIGEGSALLRTYKEQSKYSVGGFDATTGCFELSVNEPLTKASGKVLLSFSFDNGAKTLDLPVTVTVRPTVTAKLAKSALTLNKTSRSPWTEASTNVVLTPASENAVLTNCVISPATEALEISVVGGVLTARQAEGQTLIKGTYKATLTFEDVTKSSVLTVKCVETAISAKLAKSTMSFNLNWPGTAFEQSTAITMTPAAEAAVLGEYTATTGSARNPVDATDKFDVSIEDGVLTVRVINPAETAVGTYKLSIDVGADKNVSLTVKCATPAVVARLGKGALSINAAMGAGVDSVSTTLMLSDAHLDEALTEGGITVKRVVGRTQQDLTELDWQFSNGVLTFVTNDTDYGTRDVSYKLAVYADGAVDARGNAKSASLTVKVGVKKAVLTAPMKGKLDLIDPDKELTCALKLSGIATPTAELVNTGNVELRSTDGQLHDMIEVKRVSGGVAYIGWTLEGRTLAKEAALANRNRIQKISYNVVVTIAGVEYSLARNAVLTPTAVTGKITAAPATVTLFKSTPYEKAEFRLNNTAGSIDSVTLSGSGFKLYDLGDGEYAIGFDGPGAAQTLARKSKATVKLSVLLEGALKPVTVSLKLTLK